MKKFLFCLLCLVLIAVGISVYTDKREIVDVSQANSQRLAFERTSEPPQEITELGSPYKFYFNRLTDLEKRAYNAILSEIYEMPESIEIPRINSEQLDRVFTALLYDNPDLFFVGRKCTLLTQFFKTNCSIEYIMDKDDYAVKKEELEDVCSGITASLSNPEDDWQTELEIHNHIVDNCEYKIVESELIYSSAYGALVNGAAACEGYSKATKLLFDLAGLESAVVSGISADFDGEADAHMWNAVKIYGDYYYLDCTWDDPVSDDGTSTRVYTYFNLNNEMISASHSDFYHDFECASTEANYYIKTGKYFESYDRSDEGKLAEIFAGDLNSGEKVIQVRFGSAEIYEAAVEDLIEDGRIYQVLLMTDKKTDVDFSLKSILYYTDPSQLMLTVIPEIYG